MPKMRWTSVEPWKENLSMTCKEEIFTTLKRYDFQIYSHYLHDHQSNLVIEAFLYPAVFLYHYVAWTVKGPQSSPTCQGWGVCCHVYVNSAHKRTPVDHWNISIRGTSTYSERLSGYKADMVMMVMMKMLIPYRVPTIPIVDAIQYHGVLDDVDPIQRIMYFILQNADSIQNVDSLHYIFGGIDAYTTADS